MLLAQATDTGICLFRQSQQNYQDNSKKPELPLANRSIRATKRVATEQPVYYTDTAIPR
jgi:hypothetical protein